MSQPSASFPPPPPPGLNYIEAIRPSLNFILCVTPLGAVLVPLIIVLFVFSPPRSRRHPVFILNVLACCSGITEAVLNAVVETTQILSPLEPVSQPLLTALIALAIVSPLFIDSILLFRIFAFYPINTTPKTTLVAIVVFPLLVKCARFTAVVLFLNEFRVRSGNMPNVFLAAESIWPRNPFIMVEWTLQMVDNAYASSIFLYKIWKFRKGRRDIFVMRNRSFLSYLRSLFLIALGNFVFPIVMNVASIVLVATDPSFIKGSFVLLSNNYVTIIGVVFATIWTRKQNWNRREIPSRGQPHHRQETHAGSRFAFDPTLNTGSVLSTFQFDQSTETHVQAPQRVLLNSTTSSADVELGPKNVKSQVGQKD